MTTRSKTARAGRALALGLMVVGLAIPMSAAAAPQAVEGTWTTRTRENNAGRRTIEISLEVDRDSGRGTWGWNVEPAELRGLSWEQLDGDVTDARFELVREAGTVAFTGSVRDGRGSGRFTFTANAQWVRDMGSLGYADLSPDRVFSAAIHDITTGYVRQLRDLGYIDLPVSDLFAFAIHRVTADFIRGMNELGYRSIPARQLISMRIHGVTTEWVRQVRAAMGG